MHAAAAAATALPAITTTINNNRDSNVNDTLITNQHAPAPPKPAPLAPPPDAAQPAAPAAGLIAAEAAAAAAAVPHTSISSNCTIANSNRNYWCDHCITQKLTIRQSYWVMKVTTSYCLKLLAMMHACCWIVIDWRNGAGCRWATQLTADDSLRETLQ